jgi:hypothetical protein
MVGMTISMVAGMMTGLVIGEVAGYFTHMFWGNLIGLAAAVPLGGYLGRHAGLMGILNGAAAGVMGGMMGAMTGAMLRSPEADALVTGIVLLVGQIVALAATGRLVQSTSPLPATLPDYYEALDVSLQATSRDVVAAYLKLTDPAAPQLPPERTRLVEEGLVVLSDPFRRLAYDRARPLGPGFEPLVGSMG